MTGLSWFESFSGSSTYSEFMKEPVAYFCAEYALWSSVPLYAGGLGVLSGDYLKEMSDRKFPFVALGLCYGSSGNVEGGRTLSVIWQREQGLELVMDKEGKPFLVSIPIDGREVYFQAWKWKAENGALYLFDTNVPENSNEDKLICERLYTDDRDMRLRQEIVLGIGGMRFLRALGIHPSIYHLNEGHSAFLAFELISHEMRHRNVDYETACEYAREHIVFTNHTLVSAGNELFATDVVRRMLKNFADLSSIDIENVIAKGQSEDGVLFSMTTLALSFCAKTNAVSRLHATKAVEKWGTQDVGYVTNGIYIPRWDIVGTDDGGALFQKHMENKERLLNLIKEKTGETFPKDTLLLGWGRRLVPYKQPLAIFTDVERLKALATKEGRAFRIVYSGPSYGHPEDKDGFMRRLRSLAEGELKGILVFLPDYSLDVAKLMTSGSDVWINTPVIGSEACGTSGMKAALNGVLPLTTNDGWIPESGLAGVGWVLSDNDLGIKLLDTLEQDIIPLYYDRRQGEASAKWIDRMLKARQIIKDKFSATRMLGEYIEKLYMPVLAEKNRRHNEKAQG